MINNKWVDNFYVCNGLPGKCENIECAVGLPIENTFKTVCQ